MFRGNIECAKAMKQNKQEEATEKVTVRMPSRSKEIFNLNYCILPIVYISIRIFIRFLFRTYFAQHTFSNGRSNQWKSGLWFYFSYSRFLPMHRDNKIKKKKKESFQICQAKSKFAGAGLATRQSFHSGHLQ